MLTFRYAMSMDSRSHDGKILLHEAQPLPEGHNLRPPLHLLAGQCLKAAM